jgi:hypothetical protein
MWASRLVATNSAYCQTQTALTAAGVILGFIDNPHFHTGTATT